VERSKIVGNRYGALKKASDARLRLGGVSFLNARPVLYGLLQDLSSHSYQLEMAAPAELSRQMLEEELDAALAPTALLAHHGNLEIVPHIAISSDGPVGSVLIVSECPISELESLVLDHASRSSIVLARVLMERAYKLKNLRYRRVATAQLSAQVSGKSGALIIGDEALRVRGCYRYELDLGGAWKDWTGLPFVFAVWSAVPGLLTSADVDHLTASLEAGLSARSSIAMHWAEVEGGSAANYESYLTQNIQYRLDDRSIQGLELFLQHAAELKLLPQTKLRFVGAMGHAAIPQSSLDTLLLRAAEGERLSFNEALQLGQHAPAHELGIAADMRRRALHPEGVVSYIVDRNINYTNVCTTSCRFCAFYRPVGHTEGYVLSREVLAKKIQETVDAGGIQILLQGGLNPDLGLNWYEDLFRWMKTEFPIALHALSPEEIWHLSRLENLSLEDVLRRLQNSGMDSLPGGGAEVLTDRVRRKIARAKCTSEEWLECMRVAHTLGMKSTATMMFGTSDTWVDRIAHLLKIRDLQDETQGFTAFISWDYQHEQGTRIIAGETGTVLYLKMQALSRLVLDNIPNIQSSWVTQGPAVGQLGLRYGANDMGSVMFEENVVSSAGTVFGMDALQIENHARAAGFRVVQRNMRYQWLSEPRE